MRSTAIQLLTGVAAPTFLAYLGNIIFAVNLNYRWLPRSGKEWVTFTGSSLSKAGPSLLGLSLLQVVVAGGLVYAQNWSRETVMTELDRRMNERLGEVHHGS